MSNINITEITELLQAKLAQFSETVSSEEVGVVLQAGDGIAKIYGLPKVGANEMVEFSNGVKGVILNLEENYVSAALLGSWSSIKEGDLVKRLRKPASILVGEGLLGRVINAIGEPIDNKGSITGELVEMPFERKAPEVIYRQPVKAPLQTGIKAIDTMIPIGKGQRELIIGDRQTGKTSLLIDTIINQKTAFDSGNPVYCIYVSVGQKNSTIVNLQNMLAQFGAMAYTTIIAASAAEPAPMQFYAPYSGMAIGEYFRDTGRDALIIFDDLSKQAISYREVSLLLKRPPGREAYPGDVFYLHSRLLERAARIINSDAVAQKMNDLPVALQGKVKGGGSLTALPVIETQDGDVSAYIPTNVISITDGQIFLESNLFNAGVRPAINVGLSVSRVGGAAQLKAMKKVAGMLKLNQAQYRELEAFTKFGGEVDKATMRTLEKGRKNVELLKQPNLAPVKVAHQIALFYCSVNDLLDKVPLEKVSEFEQTLLLFLENTAPEVVASLNQGNLNAPEEACIKQLVAQIVSKWSV